MTTHSDDTDPAVEVAERTVREAFADIDLETACSAFRVVLDAGSGTRGWTIMTPRWELRALEGVGERLATVSVEQARFIARDLTHLIDNVGAATGSVYFLDLVQDFKWQLPNIPIAVVRAIESVLTDLELMDDPKARPHLGSADTGGLPDVGVRVLVIAGGHGYENAFMLPNWRSSTGRQVRHKLVNECLYQFHRSTRMVLEYLNKTGAETCDLVIATLDNEPIWYLPEVPWSVVPVIESILATLLRRNTVGG